MGEQKGTGHSNTQPAEAPAPDDVAQGQQASVDADGLLEADAHIARPLVALGA